MNRDPDGGPRTLTRRAALRTAAGTVAAGVAGTGVAGTAAAQGGVDYGGWFGNATGGETGNFDGTVDRTGQDSVTVDVGAEGNGGPYAFGPAAVRVDPGTTITFEWVSNTHNILIESQPSGASWGGVEAIENSGFSHEHTFETEGIYKYYCQPHLALGMKGAIVVGGGGGGGSSSGGVAADYGDWFGNATGGETGNFDGTVDRTGRDSVTVDVGAEGNGGPYAFGPAAVRIDPGTTVTFEWVSDTHNVLIQEQPSGAGWSGHETIENSGFTYEHTFETEGVYKYYCQPHLALGMKGAIVVGAAPSGGGGGGGETPAGGGEAGGAGSSPALTLAFRLVGGAVAAALAVVLGVTAWVFINYDEFTTGGGTAGAVKSVAERTPAESVFESGVVRELGHDDFDPYGTATLIAIYVGLISLLWVFMYFVEFLGGGPTVIG
ncbi:halocyanin domain-containing protein [Haloplanus natans]|uniref:halocyanin domain-containing protein n=1 Tax=Haloplanus natans TaxID=376171 RepID=UPI000677F8CE|nr:halocyanin domain-containing protein [Haloplanus natans]